MADVTEREKVQQEIAEIRKSLKTAGSLNQKARILKKLSVKVGELEKARATTQ